MLLLFPEWHTTKVQKGSWQSTPAEARDRPAAWPTYPGKSCKPTLGRPSCLHSKVCNPCIQNIADTSRLWETGAQRTSKSQATRPTHTNPPCGGVFFFKKRNA